MFEQFNPQPIEIKSEEDLEKEKQEEQAKEGGEEKEENKEEKKKEGPEGDKEISPEMTPEEKQEKEKLIQEVMSGLGNLYELLPKNEQAGAERNEVTKEEIEKLINLTSLEILTIPIKNSLVAHIKKLELWELSSKADFIAQGMETNALGLWIHAHALSRAFTKEMDAMQDSRG